MLTRDNSAVTDSDLLAAPGGPYAVLRRLREAAVVAAVAATSAVPHAPYPPYPPAQDPWALPPWNVDTLFLPLYSTVVT